MKVLKNGKVNVGKPWVGKMIRCGLCHGSFKLEPQDQKRVALFSDKRGGDYSVDYYSVKCPTLNCGNFITWNC